jgi:hypothetical protein
MWDPRDPLSYQPGGPRYTLSASRARDKFVEHISVTPTAGAHSLCKVTEEIYRAVHDSTARGCRRRQLRAVESFSGTHAYMYSLCLYTCCEPCLRKMLVPLLAAFGAKARSVSHVVPPLAIHHQLKLTATPGSRWRARAAASLARWPAANLLSCRYATPFWTE